MVERELTLTRRKVNETDYEYSKLPLCNVKLIPTISSNSLIGVTHWYGENSYRSYWYFPQSITFDSESESYVIEWGRVAIAANIRSTYIDDTIGNNLNESQSLTYSC
jgi:hypothetical protein